jgi:hypothetical protein
LRTFGSFKFANHKKDWVRKSQIRKVSHLRKARKSDKFFSRKFADLRFVELTFGPPTFVDGMHNCTVLHYCDSCQWNALRPASIGPTYKGQILTLVNIFYHGILSL